MRPCEHHFCVLLVRRKFSKYRLSLVAYSVTSWASTLCWALLGMEAAKVSVFWAGVGWVGGTAFPSQIPAVQGLSPSSEGEERMLARRLRGLQGSLRAPDLYL